MKEPDQRGRRRRPAPYLPPRHRMQCQIHRAPGQCFCDLREQGEIGRARHEKPPRPASAIHQPLQGREQLGAFLRLVEGEVLFRVQRKLRLALQDGQHREVIQSPVSPLGEGPLVQQQSAFADLARPRVDHDGHPAQCAGQTRGQFTRQEVCHNSPLRMAF